MGVLRPKRCRVAGLYIILSFLKVATFRLLILCFNFLCTSIPCATSPTEYQQRQQYLKSESHGRLRNSNVREVCDTGSLLWYLALVFHTASNFGFFHWH